MSDLPEPILGEVPASNFKVDLFELGDRVLELVKERKRLRDIARILTDDVLAAKGESISHEAVGAWLRNYRQEQAEIRKIAAGEYWRENIGASVEVLDRLANKLIHEFERPFEEIVEDLGLFGISREKIPIPYEMQVKLSSEIRQVVVARQKLGSGETSTGDLGALLHDLDDSAGEANE